MRRALKAVTLVLVGLIVIGVTLVLYLRLVMFRHPCNKVQTVLSRDGRGTTVVSVFRACTAVGTSVSAWVDLVSPTGSRIRLFTYVPWGGETDYRGKPVKGPFEPSATWISPSELRLSTGTIDRVIQERSDAAGVHITYEIQTDLSKSRME